MPVRVLAALWALALAHPGVRDRMRIYLGHRVTPLFLVAVTRPVVRPVPTFDCRNWPVRVTRLASECRWTHRGAARNFRQVRMCRIVLPS